MISYKDMTFCKEWTCKNFGNGCLRSLTEEVLRGAEKWWGDSEGGPPIAMFSDRPSCYIESNFVGFFEGKTDV
jgi:hypothetical protein